MCVDLRLILAIVLICVIIFLVYRQGGTKSGFIAPKYDEVFNDTQGKITYSDFKVLFPEHIDNVDFNELKNKWLLYRK